MLMFWETYGLNVLYLEDLCRIETDHKPATPEEDPTPTDAETDGQSSLDVTHENDDTEPTSKALEEWDSDSSFEFDIDDWPVKTPKFVWTMYQREIFPFEIIEEGQRILYGYYYTLFDVEPGKFTHESELILIKKKDVKGPLKLKHTEKRGSRRYPLWFCEFE